MAESALAAKVRDELSHGEASRAAASVLRELGPQILGYLRRVVRDHDDADDAFGRFSEDVWNGLSSFRGDASLETWCYRVAWHSALRVLRDPYRVRRARLASTEAERIAEEVRTSTAPFLKSAAQDRIAHLRDALPPEDQTLLLLRLEKQLSWREVASVLAEEGVDVGEAALRKRYERIKDKIRALAEADGILTPPDDGENTTR